LAAFADDHGVDVAIEMHPNFLVYNPPTLLRLREATNERIGANLDPANIVWQGIDIPEAIRYLGEHDAIYLLFI
jgi:DNA-(apurinic or apyrimidinic site) lyase